MSSLDKDRFVKIMKRGFDYELRAAYSVAGLAAALEAAQEGLGASLLVKFANDPEEICPPWPPFPLPHPKEPWPGPHPGPGPDPAPPYDKALLGAALIYTADFLSNKGLATIAAERGAEMIDG